MKRRDTVPMGFRLDRKIMEEFKEECRRQMRPFNLQLEIVLREWLEMQKKSRSIHSSTESGKVLVDKIK